MKRNARLILTVDEIREIVHFQHWIPITRGFHHEFIDKNYPGWSWNDFLPVLDRAGLVRLHEDGHECERLRQGYCIVPGIKSVELKQTSRATKVVAVEYLTHEL